MPFHFPSSKCSSASNFAFVQFRTERGQRLGPNSHTSFSVTQAVCTEPQRGLAGGDSQWLTNRITLPSPPALAKAGAVQHVPLIVTLVEGLVHVIGDAIHNALVWGDRREFISNRSKHLDRTLLPGTSFIPSAWSAHRLTTESSVQAERSPPVSCDPPSAAHTPLLLSSSISTVQISNTCRREVCGTQSSYRTASLVLWTDSTCERKSKPPRWLSNHLLWGTSRLKLLSLKSLQLHKEKRAAPNSWRHSEEAQPSPRCYSAGYLCYPL